MLLDQGVHDIGVSSQFLLRDEVVQLADRKSLNSVLITIEVGDGQADDSVYLTTGADMVLKSLSEIPNEIIVQRPTT